MSQKTPRMRRHARTTARILETAEKIVLDGGIEALTIAKLADAIDYTPGALYRYFPSKDALLVAMQRHTIALCQMGFAKLRDRTDALAHHHHLTPGQQALADLLGVAALYRALAVHHPARFWLVSAILGDPRHMVAENEAIQIAAPLIGLMGEISERMETAARHGTLRSGTSLQRSTILISALQGVLQVGKLERLAPDAIHAQALAAQLAISLMRGWGANEADLVAARAVVDTLSPQLEELVQEPLLSIVEAA